MFLWQQVMFLFGNIKFFGVRWSELFWWKNYTKKLDMYYVRLEVKQRKQMCIFKQSSSRRAAYCSPHGPPPPPPQLFGFRITTNLSISASSYFTYPHITGEVFMCHFDSHIINPLITKATNEEHLASAFQEKVFFNLANMFSNVSRWPD